MRRSFDSNGGRPHGVLETPRGGVSAWNQPHTCVVLAGGTGQRLQTITQGRNKHLLPLGDAPILSHVLTPIVNTPSVDRIVVVCGPNDAEEIDRLLADTCATKPARICVQEQAEGTLSAVLLALPLVASDVLAVHYGDNIFGWNALPAPPRDDDAIDAIVYSARASVKDLHAFGVLQTRRIAGRTLLRGIEEKPKIVGSRVGRGDIATGFYRFRQRSMERIAPLVVRSTRCEYEFTAFISELAKSDRVLVEPIDAAWTDIGTPAGLARGLKVLAARSGRSPGTRGLGSA